MSEKKYVYWDSNMFICFLQDEERASEILGVVKAAQEKKLTIVTSAFTMTEVVKYKDRKTGERRSPIGRKEQNQLNDAFSPENGVLVVNVDRNVALLAREAIWDFGIEPADGIHVGSAMYFLHALGEKGSTIEFHTFDKNLNKKLEHVSGIIPVEPNVDLYPYQMDMLLLMDSDQS